MSRPPGPRLHADVVEVWLAAAGSSVTAEALVRRLDLALGALWARAEVTLGRVTVVAIVDRVLINASGRCSHLTALTIEPRRGVSCESLLGRAAGLQPATLVEGIRALLVELLTLIGKLTAEILTPALHATLLSSAAQAEPVARARADAPTRAARGPGGGVPSRGAATPHSGSPSGPLGQEAR